MERRSRSAEVWLDDGNGNRTRVWPPPWGQDVPHAAAEDARKAFELLARSAQASREEAVRRAERELAASFRREQRGEGRNRELSRAERRRQRAAPPMDGAAWWRWSNDFGCAQRASTACCRPAGPAARSLRACSGHPPVSVPAPTHCQFAACAGCRRCADRPLRPPDPSAATVVERAVPRRRSRALATFAAPLTTPPLQLSTRRAAFLVPTGTQRR